MNLWCGTFDIFGLFENQLEARLKDGWNFWVRKLFLRGIIILIAKFVDLVIESFLLFKKTIQQQKQNTNWTLKNTNTYLMAVAKNNY